MNPPPVALEPLDSFVDQFSYRDGLQDIAPARRDDQMKVNDVIYGFPDDGDVMLLCHRKDIFEDLKMLEELKTGNASAWRAANSSSPRP